MIVSKIIEIRWIEEYLNKRWLTRQYIKDKNTLKVYKIDNHSTS